MVVKISGEKNYTQTKFFSSLFI